jgi:hypothetical protein
MGIDYIEKLNETFLELLADLITVFPDDGDFHLYHATSTTAFAMDPDFLYHVFKKNVSKYADQILARDENFMIQLDIESQLQTSADRVKEYLIYVIMKLRHTFRSLDEESKDVIWKYWRTMILIYRRIEAEKEKEDTNAPPPT